jgi:hypothetical protein
MRGIALIVVAHVSFFSPNRSYLFLDVTETTGLSQSPLLLRFRSSTNSGTGERFSIKELSREHSFLDSNLKSERKNSQARLRFEQ